LRLAPPRHHRGSTRFGSDCLAFRSASDRLGDFEHSPQRLCFWPTLHYFDFRVASSTFRTRFDGANPPSSIRSGCFYVRLVASSEAECGFLSGYSAIGYDLFNYVHRQSARPATYFLGDPQRVLVDAGDFAERFCDSPWSAGHWSPYMRRALFALNYMAIAPLSSFLSRRARHFGKRIICRDPEFHPPDLSTVERTLIVRFAPGSKGGLNAGDEILPERSSLRHSRLPGMPGLVVFALGSSVPSSRLRWSRRPRVLSFPLRPNGRSTALTLLLCIPHTSLTFLCNPFAQAAESAFPSSEVVPDQLVRPSSCPRFRHRYLKLPTAVRRGFAAPNPRESYWRVLGPALVSAGVRKRWGIVLLHWTRSPHLRCREGQHRRPDPQPLSSPLCRFILQVHAHPSPIHRPQSDRTRWIAETLRWRRLATRRTKATQRLLARTRRKFCDSMLYGCRARTGDIQFRWCKRNLAPDSWGRLCGSCTADGLCSGVRGPGCETPVMGAV